MNTTAPAPAHGPSAQTSGSHHPSDPRCEPHGRYTDRCFPCLTGLPGTTPVWRPTPAPAVNLDEFLVSQPGPPAKPGATPRKTHLVRLESGQFFVNCTGRLIAEGDTTTGQADRLNLLTCVRCTRFAQDNGGDTGEVAA